MAAVSRRQPSGVVSTGLSVATVALNIAGAAADAVPIAKQILDCAAHISAAAEKIQKKRDAMYTLVEKADIYATQIDIAVAGRILDASLQRRLERLYSVFINIEALVEAKAWKHNPLTRAWQNIVTKPNRAETLVVELEREIQLFQLLTGIQLSMVVDDTARVVDDTARAVAADAKYDGQFRIVRDCDIEKLDVIHKRETDEGVVVWASARVKRQLMVIRYLESQSNAESNAVTSFKSSSQPWNVYLENIKKISTVHGSHPHIVQLYGRHAQGPGAVFRAGTFFLLDYLDKLRRDEENRDSAAVRRLTLAYKILDASSYLEDAHGLTWVGGKATVDENGEPRIGLFDNIVRADPKRLRRNDRNIYFYILVWSCSRRSEETGIVDQVYDGNLHTIIAEQVRDGYDTDCLQRVWGIIRQERLCVTCQTTMFPIISRNLSLSQEMVARAQLFYQTCTEGFALPYNSFVRCVLGLEGGFDTSSRILAAVEHLDGDKYLLRVETCALVGNHIRYEIFEITIGCPLSAEIARAVGRADGFEDYRRCEPIYPVIRK